MRPSLPKKMAALVAFVVAMLALGTAAASAHRPPACDNGVAAGNPHCEPGHGDHDGDDHDGDDHDGHDHDGHDHDGHHHDGHHHDGHHINRVFHLVGIVVDDVLEVGDLVDNVDVNVNVDVVGGDINVLNGDIDVPDTTVVVDGAAEALDLVDTTVLENLDDADIDADIDADVNATAVLSAVAGLF